MRNFIKNLLKKEKIWPKRRLGQNFLISKRILKEIIKSSQLKPNDTVLEIGPGLGILTAQLAKRAKKVICVEKDSRLAKLLKEEMKNFKNVEVFQGDILKIKNKNLKLKIKNYKLVANLPYYITSPLIRMFLETKNPPKLMVLMVQKEVAQRICASPPKMSKLAVFCQFYGKPKIIKFVSKKAFWPQPKVDSAILKIIPQQLSFSISSQFRAKFAKIVKAGFSQPRKQLINNLSNSLNLSRKKVKKWLKGNNIEPTQRAQELSVEDWRKLAKSFL